ncbi:MAG TPA: division/cell wall cluster transcriptional repressor MraZ [Gammaproteobacteria bacterium]|nr:division/cell wall cluster transcriptional repressor MraZ [Gammaproteobacteria bacterium]
MFRGINLIQLDAKGRMAMPARYRTRLQDLAQGRLIVTIDTQEACLLLYPLPEWELIEQKIEALPSFHKAARRIQRLLIGHATELELDSNGRILLPPLLREYAALDKQVMLVGQGKKFEIWSETGWQQEREEWLTEETTDESLPPELQTLSL